MPSYDDKCKESGSRFELRLCFDDPIEQPCNNCKSLATRQFTAVPVMFKGDGWYVNDYGKGDRG